MVIREIPVSQIKPSAYNPRKDLKPTDPEYQKIKKSIEEFGMVEPIVWNERTGNLVGGHQRFKYLTQEKKHDKLTVSVVDLDQKKEQALNVALNKVSGAFDIPKLKELLVELDDGAFDLTLTGFDELELKDLIDFEGKKGLTEDDEVPPVPADPVTKTGDLYLLGEHRLLCGDSTKREDVERLMDGQLADMVFTDPPYGISIVKTGTVGASSRVGFVSPRNAPAPLARARKYRVIEGDDKPFDPNLILSLGFKTVILWGANHYASKLPDKSQWLIWDKKIESGDLDHNNFSDCELAWTSSDALSTKIYRHTWAGMLRSGDRDEELKERVHPTQKPVGLCAAIISDFSEDGNSVIDLYLGSGSTLIACEKTGCKCYGMEIDPAYCDVIVSRWEKFTGKKSERIEADAGVLKRKEYAHGR